MDNFTCKSCGATMYIDDGDKPVCAYCQSHLLKKIEPKAPQHSKHYFVVAAMVSVAIFALYFLLKPNTPAQSIPVQAQSVSKVAPVKAVMSHAKSDIANLHTSYIEPDKRAQIEAQMTPWMSRDAYQKLLDEYQKEQKEYPLYIEVNPDGDRRMLVVNKEPFSWTVSSGMDLPYFRTKDTKQSVGGKKLLSLQVMNVNGVKFYTAVWVAKTHWEHEAKRLRAMGIHPHGDVLDTSVPVEIDLASLKTSYIEPEKRTEIETQMTPWMSRDVYQKMYDGYYKEHNEYPIYIETNSVGERRVLIAKSPGGWSTRSGLNFETFKKVHVEKKIANQKLLSLHIIEIEGTKFYSAVWIRTHLFEQEAAHLRAMGIHPPSDVLDGDVSVPEINLEMLKTSYIEPDKRNEIEAKMTPWMIRSEFQKLFDENRFGPGAEKLGYPIYVETNEIGERRMLVVKKERFYWAVYSGRAFKDFKKLDTVQRVKGRTLLSLHVLEVNGIKFYTGTWVANDSWEHEAARLRAMGIHPVAHF